MPLPHAITRLWIDQAYSSQLLNMLLTHFPCSLTWYMESSDTVAMILRVAARSLDWYSFT